MTKSPAKNHFPKNLFTILFFCFLAVSLGSCSGGGGGGGSSPAPSTTYWAKTYGGPNDDLAHWIQQTSDGGFIIAGETSSSGAGFADFWILKLNANGEVAWQKTYGGSNDDIAYSIQQTSDGFIVVGMSDSFSNPLGDIWVLKLSTNGEVIWQKTYRESGSNLARYVLSISDGFVVAGETSSFGTGNADFWVLKLNSSGDVIWQKTYGGSNNDRIYSIQKTPSDNGFIIAGETSSFGTGNTDFWVLKLDSSGNVLWQKTYGGINDDIASSIQETLDGGFIVAGETSSFGTGNADFWLLKLNSSGDVIWQKTYGGSNNDRIHSIQTTSDGGFIVAGETSSSGAGNADFWVLKLDGNGNIGSGCSVIGTSSATVSSTGITAVDSSGTVNNTNATVTQTSVTPQDSTALIATQCSSP